MQIPAGTVNLLYALHGLVFLSISVLHCPALQVHKVISKDMTAATASVTSSRANDKDLAASANQLAESQRQLQGCRVSFVLNLLNVVSLDQALLSFSL